MKTKGIPFHPNDDGIRPAGPPDVCFYCNQKVGFPHIQTCVAVKKTVRLRFLVEVDAEMQMNRSTGRTQKLNPFSSMKAIASRI